MGLRRSGLPMARLDLLLPLVEGLERLGLSAEPVLARHDLVRAAVAQDDMFVPASLMYKLVEDLAEFSGDPYFGIHVGERLNPWSWSPLAQAAAAARTVGDYLIRFSMAAGSVASSVDYALETTGDRSRFSARRITDGGLQPRHNDGFTLAYVLGIIQPAVGSAWVGQRVLASVTDPAVVPPGYRGMRLASTGNLGFSLAFPSEWLLLTPQLDRGTASVQPDGSAPRPTDSVLDSLRLVLRPHLHEAGLNAERVATLCGLSKRTLARRLQQRGTSLSAELAGLRRTHAETLLEQEKFSVAEVGARVGYPEAAVFSRAFRRWTGQTPRAYRQDSARRSDEPGGAPVGP